MSALLVPISSPISPKAALTAVGRIAEKWGLRRADLPVLLGRKPRTVRSWYERSPGSLDGDVLERIGHLLAIYNGLHLIFAASFADRWVHEPNAAFGGEPPIASILAGSFTALVNVRNYVDAAARA